MKHKVLRTHAVVNIHTPDATYIISEDKVSKYPVKW